MGYSGSMPTGRSGGSNIVASALGVVAAHYASKAAGGKQPSIADQDLYARRRYEEQHHAAEQTNKHTLMQNNQAHKQRMKEESHTVDNMIKLNPESHIERASVKEKSVQFSDKPRRRPAPTPVAPPKSTPKNKSKKSEKASETTPNGDSTFNPEITGPKDKPTVTPETLKTKKTAKTPAAKKTAKAPAAKKTAKAPAAKKTAKAPTAKKTSANPKKKGVRPVDIVPDAGSVGGAKRPARTKKK